MSYEKGKRKADVLGGMIESFAKRGFKGSHPVSLTQHMPKMKRAQRSSTSTKSSSKGIATGKIYNEGGGGQYSYFNAGTGKSYLPKHVLNALPPQSIVSAAPLQLKSTVGLQNVALATSLCNMAIATTFTGDKITSVVFEKASADVTINNIFLSNAYIIIYDIVARKDIGNILVSTPFAVWNQGTVDTGATNSYQVLGSTPFQSELFNQFYAVKQTTNVVLQAGGTHVHKVRMHPNKLISAAFAQYTPYACKDLTYYCMIEVHGSPANDSTTQTQVSVGVSGLNIIVDQEVTLKQIQKATPTVTTTNTLPLAFTVGEQVVNMGGSTIQAQAEG